MKIYNLNQGEKIELATLKYGYHQFNIKYSYYTYIVKIDKNAVNTSISLYKKGAKIENYIDSMFINNNEYNYIDKNLLANFANIKKANRESFIDSTMFFNSLKKEYKKAKKIARN